MILESKDPSLRQGPELVDVPPAYEEVAQRSPPGISDQKGQREIAPPSAAAAAAAAGPSTPPATQRAPKDGPAGKTWLGLGSWFGEKDARREVKHTIQSLEMRDVVKDPCSPASISVVQSCLEVCQARGIQFDSIISEKFIEGHSPLYWVIVKLPPRPAEESDAQRQVDLLDILLSFPLNSTTRADAYLACLISCDQELFQRLRRARGLEFSPSASAAAGMLLGDEPNDELVVENQEGDQGEFRVKWRIVHFQKRMRVVGGVGVEVVARGRIWCLAFIILPRDVTIDHVNVKTGSWVASVSLLSPSPPTHLDALFSIAEPLSAASSLRQSPPSPSAAPPHPPPKAAAAPPAAAPHHRDFRLRWPNVPKHTPSKPPINLRVKTDTAPLEALPLRGTAPDLREHVLTQPGTKTLIVPLNKHPSGGGLQFDGCTYLNADGSLSVTFDARLAQSNGADCVIC